MGYCYTTGGGLCCDRCDNEGARKRTCPHKVGALPFCQAPALCGACVRDLGGLRAVHAGCAEGAARAREHEARRQELLAAGELLARTCWGDWAPTVPPGHVGVRFEGRAGEAWYLVPDSVHTNVCERIRDRDRTLSDYVGLAEPWFPHE